MEELLIVLQNENQNLKEKNERLFKKNKNQQRSVCRLKKIIDKQNKFLKKAKQNNLEDQDWEDLDDLVREYENTE